MADPKERGESLGAKRRSVLHGALGRGKDALWCSRGDLEGLAEGLEKVYEIARRMKARGRPIEEIAGDTGLPEAKIKEL